MKQGNIQNCVTFGVELETDFFNSGNHNPFSSFRNTHDSSIETECTISNSGFILNNSNNKNKAMQFFSRSNITVGTEFVSVILSMEEMEKNLSLFKELTSYLEDCGEPEKSERSGIHIHFSYSSPNLNMLKTILNLGACLERLFFHVGGMGYRFRGEINDSVYCRPITKYGPPCIPNYYGGYSQVFTLDRLLETKTSDEFWYFYSDLKNINNGRYAPVRYTWLNLYPLSPYGEYKGTLEFRVFNKTLNPYYIMAIIELCQKFSEFSMISSRDNSFIDFLEVNSIYDSCNIDVLFEKAMKILTISDESAYYLLNIIKNTPKVVLPEKFVFSHLIYHPSVGSRIRGYFKEVPVVAIDSESIVKPKYIDLHVLRGEA